MRSQHSLHHHLYSVHCDLQYPHILSGPRAPGEYRHSTFYICQTGSFHEWQYSAINYTAAYLTLYKCCSSLHLSVVWSGCVSHSPCLAGPASLSFSQPRMHHSSGRLPDQHHGLWGVCPTHPSAPLLSSWVHLQLWNRCSEVPHLISIIKHHLCAVCNSHAIQTHWTECARKWLFDIILYYRPASPIMAPWRALFLSTPLTAPLLMKLWWDKELQAR